MEHPGKISLLFISGLLYSNIAEAIYSANIITQLPYGPLKYAVMCLVVLATLITVYFVSYVDNWYAAYTKRDDPELSSMS